MSWTYRVCETVQNGRSRFEIREVHSEPDGTITSYLPAFLADHESIDDLKATVERVRAAFDQPILKLDGPTIPGRAAPTS